MTKNKYTYTLEEICEAWDEFTSPKYIFNNKPLDTKELECGIIEIDNINSIHRLAIDYSRWIPFLINYKRK